MRIRSALGSAPTARVPPVTEAYGPVGRSPWLDVDWREHRRWVSVAGRRLNVVELGSGPPMVFVHGLGGLWQNWLEQLPVFAREHRVVAVDLPGFGESELPGETISIAGYARVLDALCDALGIDAAAFVGNSMGGFISAEMAIAFPQRVERLVLVSAAGLTVEHQRNDTALAALKRLETVLSTYGAWVATKSDVVARRPRLRWAAFAFVAAHPDRLPPALVTEQLRGSGKPGFLGSLDALTSYPIRDRLTEIACPTLVVWGTEDRLVPVGDADEFERLIPDSRKVVYRDTGHVPMLERPARFNADLQAFLQEQPGEQRPAPQPRQHAT